MSHSSHVLPVNIDDGIVSSVLGEEVVHTISSLGLNNVLYIPKFHVSLLSISQIVKTKNCVIFFPTYCVFQASKLGGGLVWVVKKVVFTIWMMVHYCLI